MPAVSPTLDELAVDPALAQDLAPDAAGVLLARCLAAQGALIARLVCINSTPSSTSADDRLLTMTEAAAVLSVPVTHAYELARRHEFPTVRLGKYVRVRDADLRVWLDNKTSRSPTF